MSFSPLHGSETTPTRRSTRIPPAHPFTPKSPLPKIFQNGIQNSSPASNSPLTRLKAKQLQSTSATHSVNLSKSSSAERSTNTRRQALELPIQGFLIPDQSTEEITLSNPTETEMKDAAAALLKSGSKLTHVKFVSLEAQTAWKMKPLLHNRKNSITQLTFDRSYPMAVVVMLNAFFNSHSKITRLNVIELLPAATLEIFPIVQKQPVKLSGLGLENLSLEAIQNIMPLLLDPQSEIATMWLDNLSPEAVKLLLDTLWEKQRTSARKMTIIPSHTLSAALMNRIEAFNQLPLVDEQSQSTDGKKRKSIEPDSGEKTKLSKKHA